MNTSISKEQKILDNFNAAVQSALRDALPIRAKWRRRIFRADGSVEEAIISENVVTKDGLNQLAALGIDNAASAFAYLSIGTVTAQHSLGSTVTMFGEISRKTPAIVASSIEVMIMQMTWGGAADSMAGVALGSAAMVNHASSGLGVPCNLTNSVDATLQNSDILDLQCEIQVGSHNL